MTKRQEAAKETREALVRAAGRLISENGPDDVCVEDITRAAGVSKGTFYTYFARKEDILDELAYPIFDRLLESALKEHDRADERLAAFLLGSVAHIAEGGVNLCRGWIRGIVLPDNSASKRKLQYDTDAVGRIFSESGLGRDPDLVRDIVREYYGIVFCWCISDGADDIEDEMKAFCGGTLKTLLNEKKR